MDANIQNTKIELIKWLTNLNNESLIQKIADLKENNSNDWWNEISANEKSSIDAGLSDAKKGKLSSNSLAKKIYEKWL